jgi:DNA-binding Xre family transcriptional regulator|tara:strand:+ start:321 stop:518 length:198 start_codon:yes stop_codon:yes gene_type:complete
MWNIKRYIKRRGIKANHLAKKTGMTPQQFNHHIKRKNDLPLNLVISLSEALEMSLEDLLKEVKEK